MLSLEERELARQFRELGARIVVPAVPRRRSGASIPVLAVLATLLVILVVVITVTRADDRSNTASPTTASPTASPRASSGAIATATPSHRATPFGQLPPRIVPSGGTTFTVSGVIQQTGPDGLLHPVNGARIDVFVNLTDGAGYHWMSDVTDATGRFELWGIPAGALATLYAATADPVTHAANSLQPCAHQVRVTEDVSVDVEIVPMSEGPAAATAAAYRGAQSPVRASMGPVMGGQAFERDADGTRVGVPNAMVSIGGDIEPLLATTLTNADGRYVICGVPTLQHDFSASKPGFSVVKPIPGFDENEKWVDFEMWP